MSYTADDVTNAYPRNIIIQEHVEIQMIWKMREMPLIIESYTPMYAHRAL